MLLLTSDDKIISQFSKKGKLFSANSTLKFPAFFTSPFRIKLGRRWVLLLLKNSHIISVATAPGRRTYRVHGGTDMIIAAYDPGDEHTGIAIIDTDTNIVYTHQVGGYDLVELRQFSPLGMVPNVMIAEDFRLRPALAKSLAGSPLNTARILGALEMIASIRGCEFVLQQPSQKQAWPTERIERWLGIKVRGRGPHITDALRHLCIYLKKVNDDTAPLNRERFVPTLERANARQAT